MKLSIRALLISPLLVLAACGTDATSDATPGAPTAMVETAITGQVFASGTFTGRNDHVVSGTVELVEQDGATYLRLGPGFSLDGAPDPRIGFGRSGEYDTTTTFTELERHKGEQSYLLPAGFDLGSLNEATIWCEDFSVALGVAPLH